MRHDSDDSPAKTDDHRHSAERTQLAKLKTWAVMVRKARKRTKLTQRVVAKAAGITKRCYQKLECSGLVEAATLLAVCPVLGLSLKSLQPGPIDLKQHLRTFEGVLDDGEPPYYSPPHLMAALHKWIGGPFDYDPFAPAQAKYRTVRALTYFTEAVNGFLWPWSGKVYVNGPFDQIRETVDKVLVEWNSGRVTVMIVLVPDGSTNATRRLISAGAAKIELRRLKFGGRKSTHRKDSNLYILGATKAQIVELVMLLRQYGIDAEYWKPVKIVRQANDSRRPLP